MRNKLLLIVLLSSMSSFIFYSSFAFAGKIYTWKDENGQTHFGATPPTNVESKNTGLSSQSKKSRSYKPKENYYSDKLKELEAKKQADKHKDYSPTRNTSSNLHNKTNLKNSSKPAKDWKQEIISKCKANRGVNCSNSRYVDSKRPLSKDEKAVLQRARIERLHAR